MIAAMIESIRKPERTRKEILEIGPSSGRCLLVFRLLALELISGDGLFVGVLAFQCVYDCYDYFDGRYESHCEENQRIRPWRAGEETDHHCLADTVEDV